MALLHRGATLNPTKDDLLATWLPARPWAAGVTAPRRVGNYRFDDPAGRVGLETLLVGTADGGLLQVPLTYRDAPLDGAERHLVGTAEHGVLGTRWVYDGCGDPAWVAAAVTAIRTGGTQAELLVDEGDGGVPVRREPTVTVCGSGSPGTPVAPIDTVLTADLDAVTVVTAGGYELVVARLVGADVTAPAMLTGRWEGGEGVLAGLREIAG